MRFPKFALLTLALIATPLLLSGCCSTRSHAHHRGGADQHGHAHPNVEADLIAAEKRLWQYYQDRNAASTRQESVATYRSVDSGGIHNLDEVAQAMKDGELKSWALSNITVTFPGPDTAVLTYQADYQGSYKGENTSGKYNCLAVWIRDGHDWKSVSYSETLAK